MLQANLAPPIDPAARRRQALGRVYRLLLELAENQTAVIPTPLAGDSVLTAATSTPSNTPAMARRLADLRRLLETAERNGNKVLVAFLRALIAKHGEQP